jgi:hypothetical protein
MQTAMDMRRIAQIGGVLSGVGGLLLLIYLDAVKDFLDNLLSRIFGIPKGMVGYYVVTVVIAVALIYFASVVLYEVCEWGNAKPVEPKSLPPDELARKFAVEKQKLEEIDRDRKTIYDAIKEWIQPPETRWQIGAQQEPLYLGERVPRHTQKIDDCLSRNYPEIWADLQEFRSKYTELTSLDTTIPEEFRERINGVENVKLYLLDARKDSIHHQLLAWQRQLVRKINLEIVEKLDTGLKC